MVIIFWTLCVRVEWLMCSDDGGSVAVVRIREVTLQ